MEAAGALSPGSCPGSAERRRQQRELCDGEWPGHGAAPRLRFSPGLGETQRARALRRARLRRAVVGSLGILYLFNIASHPSRPQTAISTWLQPFLGARRCGTRRGKAARRRRLCGSPDCGTPEREQMGHGQRGHGKPPGCARQLIHLARSERETRGERPRGSKNKSRDTAGSRSAFLGSENMFVLLGMRY